LELKSRAGERAISPIIATLLLILIAIVAGVVLYSYVVGFVGQTSQNSGTGSTPLQFGLASVSSTTQDTTDSVTNAGATSAQFGSNSMYIGSSALSTTPLAPEVVITASCTSAPCGAETIVISSVATAFTTSPNIATLTVTVGTITGCGTDHCWISAVTFSGISGTSLAAACGSTGTAIVSSAVCTATITISYQGLSVTSAFNAAVSGLTVTMTLPPTGTTIITQQVGTPIKTGAIVLASGAQMQIVECGAASGTTGNGMTSMASGSVYSLKVVALDGSSSIVSVKAK